jgi:hypothetical protein
MSKINLPSNDADRLALLEQALTATQSGGTPLLPAQTVAQIGDQMAAFVEARHAITQAKAAQREGRAAATQARQMLNEYIHQIWQAVVMQVRWQQLSPTVLTYYQLSVDGSGPGRSADANWIDIAKRILVGADQATAAGFTVNGVDLASLQQALDQAQTTLTAVTQARNTLLHAQQRLIEQRKEIQQLIGHLLGDLRYALRDEAPVHRRQTLRLYGVRFRYEETSAEVIGDNSSERSIALQLAE